MVGLTTEAVTRKAGYVACPGGCWVYEGRARSQEGATTKFRPCGGRHVSTHDKCCHAEHRTNIGVIMSSRALLASLIAAVLVGAGVIIGLTSTEAPTSVSRNAPTCAVRTSAAATPTAKATPFG